MMKFVTFFVLICWAIPGEAQWRSDSTTNTVVCKMSNTQHYPAACTDGSNGLIVVWEDYRSGGDWNLFAQRLDANGVKMWPDTGVAICRASGSQRKPLIASDGAGGAFIIWEDRRNVTAGVDIYAQHISGSGAISYATDGVAVGSGTRDQENAALTASSGAAYAAWEDSRPTNTVTRPDIYMNRLTTAGPQWGTGRAIITQSNQQRRPQLVDDGSGGCLLAWQTTVGVPPSIWATRVNSNGTVMWGTQGATVYRGPAAEMTARNVALGRDGNQFLLAWEVTNSNPNFGQDIYANRMSMDSTKAWFSSAEVTGEWPGDQLYPKVITDDSGGMYVVFNDASSSQTQLDIATVRVMQNGIDRVPKFSDGFLWVTRQTRGQVGHQIVKSDNGFLAVWDDGREMDGDTSIYAQRIDRNMKRSFPTYGTNSTWGLPLSVSKTATAKHVQLVPRTNGAIAVWADDRNGSLDIYAQLVFKDGTLPIELSQFDVREENNAVSIVWQTAMELENAGFEIERREIAERASNQFEVVASYLSDARLRGAGTSNTRKQYATEDRPGAGIFEYRLVDVALNGVRTPHTSKRVEIGFSSGVTELGEAYPNPSVAGFRIPVTLPASSQLRVRVFNMLGREMSNTLIAARAGSQQISVDASHLTQGSYRCTIDRIDDHGNATPIGTRLLTVIR